MAVSDEEQARQNWVEQLRNEALVAYDKGRYIFVSRAYFALRTHNIDLNDEEKTQSKHADKQLEKHSICGEGNLYKAWHHP